MWQKICLSRRLRTRQRMYFRRKSRYSSWQ